MCEEEGREGGGVFGRLQEADEICEEEKGRSEVRFEAEKGQEVVPPSRAASKADGESFRGFSAAGSTVTSKEEYPSFEKSAVHASQRLGIEWAEVSSGGEEYAVSMDVR